MTTIRIAIIAGFTLLASLAPAQAFSWKALVGLTTAEFTESISAVATCGAVVPLTFNIPAITPKTRVDPDFEAPLSAGLKTAGGEYLSSSVIDKIDCTIGEAARIRGYFHDGKVFRINIHYIRCGAAECDPAPRDFDQQIYDGMTVKNGYGVEHTGNTALEGTFFATHYKLLFGTRGNYFIERMSEADRACWFERDPRLGRFRTEDEQIRYRCLIDGSVQDGIWHSIAMGELYKPGVTSDQVLGHLAARQQFLHVKSDKQATAEFVASLRNFVKRRRAERRDAGQATPEPAGQALTQQDRQTSVLGTTD